MSDDAAEPFPPAPWVLRGRLLVSVFRVPERLVPELVEAVPVGHRPVRLGGGILVALAFAQYGPAGTLAYEELLAAVITRPAGRLRIRLTVPQIWVTTPAAAAGGRALWAIPKERCEVAHRSSPALLEAGVTTEGRPLTSLGAVIGRVLLHRFRARLVTAQRGGGGTAVVARHRLLARVQTLRARWQVPAGGPLGHLTGRRPLLSVALTDAAVVFGIAWRDE